MKSDKSNLCVDPNQGEMVARFEMGRLSEQEVATFEDHLMVCDHCRDEVSAMLPVVQAFRANRSKILAGLSEDGISFNGLRDKLMAESRRGGFGRAFEEFILNLLRPKVWVPAVSVAAACIFLLFRFTTHTFVNPYSGFLEFEALPYSAEQTRAPFGTGKESFDAGMVDYNHKNYSAAIRNLKKAVDEAPENEVYWTYLGVAYYLDHNPKLAVESLEKADALAGPMLRTRLAWFRAQAYLLEGDSTHAVPLLQTVISNKGDRAADAESLLTHIRSSKSRG